MPPGYYDQLKAMIRDEAAARRCGRSNGDKNIMTWSFVVGHRPGRSRRKENMSCSSSCLEPDTILTG